jgi:hypothetical protein
MILRTLSILTIATLGLVLPEKNYAEELGTILLRKDGKIIRVPAPPKPEGKLQLSDADRFVNEEEKQAAQELFNAALQAQGLPPGPMFQYPTKEDLDPKTVQIFEIPEDQAIGGCMYARGYSYPSTCFDENNKVIFDVDKDSQAVLDALKEARGVSGEYNVIPLEDVTVNEDSQSVTPSAPDQQLTGTLNEIDQ